MRLALLCLVIVVAAPARATTTFSPGPMKDCADAWIALNADVGVRASLHSAGCYWTRYAARCVAARNQSPPAAPPSNCE